MDDYADCFAGLRQMSRYGTLKPLSRRLYRCVISPRSDSGDDAYGLASGVVVPRRVGGERGLAFLGRRAR